MDSTTLAPATATTVATSLADKINAEHQACLSAANDALDHALRAGELLIEAKAGCTHGQWQHWLADNFAGSDRTARAYMRIARHREVIEANRQTTADLTLERALLYIAPKREPSPDIEKIIDDMLDGPFRPSDFAHHDGRVKWLKIKIEHQLKLPAVAGFALTTDINTDPPMLRVVSDCELLDAFQALAPYLGNKAGFTTVGLTANQYNSIQVLLACMAGAIINEIEHRYGPLHGRKIGKRKLSDKQHQIERAAALEQFSTAINQQLAELSV